MPEPDEDPMRDPSAQYVQFVIGLREFQIANHIDSAERELYAACEQYLDQRRYARIAVIAASTASITTIVPPLLFVTVSTGTAWIQAAAYTASAIAALHAGITIGGRMTLARWIKSLHRVLLLPPMAPDVRVRQFAKAYLAGRTHVAGRVEKALMMLWKGDGSPKQVARARRTLVKNQLPDVEDGRYKKKPDSALPLWCAEGIDWQVAPLPDEDHQCQAWMVGVVKNLVAMQCACGGVNMYPFADWIERNARRHLA